MCKSGWKQKIEKSLHSKIVKVRQCSVSIEKIGKSQFSIKILFYEGVHNVQKVDIPKDLHFPHRDE